jgi:hypothetical protein
VATTPSPATRAEPSEAEIAEAILAAVAEVRAQRVSELREEVDQAGGDLRSTRVRPKAVIAILETRYGRTLAKVEDLEPECLPSIASLGELIHRRWPDRHSLTASETEAGS